MHDNRRTLMMIDDNLIDLKINSKMIQMSKLFDRVILCQSGEEGISYLRNHITKKEEWPDFILLDIQMPEMSGFDFLELYKRLPEEFITNCPIAILSSTLDFGDIKKAEANPYIVKLLKKPLLLQEIADVLKLHSK